MKNAIKRCKRSPENYYYHCGELEFFTFNRILYQHFPCFFSQVFRALLAFFCLFLLPAQIHEMNACLSLFLYGMRIYGVEQRNVLRTTMYTVHIHIFSWLQATWNYLACANLLEWNTRRFSRNLLQVLLRCIERIYIYMNGMRYPPFILIECTQLQLQLQLQ